MLSDWPVRDMDKERHLVHDPSFEIFERASYGHGCEIQPIIDDKHKKCKKFHFSFFINIINVFSITSVLSRIWFTVETPVVCN